MKPLFSPPTLIPWPCSPGDSPGRLKTDPPDFRVDEIAAYAPSGEGQFYFVQVEKENVASGRFVRVLADRAGVPSSEIGLAGQKDKRAITRQWVSLPDRADLRSIDGPLGDDAAIRVLEIARHHRKLKTGHLRGNRFTVIARDVASDAHAAIAERVAHVRREGFANSYGAQRFGGGDTVKVGWDALGGARIKNRRLRRLGVSALQASLFNHWLDARAKDDLMATVITGDELKKRETGGLFVCEDVKTDQARLDAGELVQAGPIFGWKFMRPRAEAAHRETAILDRFGLAPDDFRVLKKLALGTRRPARIWPEDLDVSCTPEAVTLTFTLPPGAYATVLARMTISAALEIGPPRSTVVSDSRSE